MSRNGRYEEAEPLPNKSSTLLVHWLFPQDIAFSDSGSRRPHAGNWLLHDQVRIARSQGRFTSIACMAFFGGRPSRLKLEQEDSAPAERSSLDASFRGLRDLASIPSLSYPPDSRLHWGGGVWVAWCERRNFSRRRVSWCGHRNLNHRCRQTRIARHHPD